MRSLLAADSSELFDEDLVELYRYPNGGALPWVRAIFVSSVDGSAQGPDGVSASLSSPGDRRVFGLQRSLCDVVLVGAGTARVEGYRPVEPSEVDVALRRRLGLAETPALAVVSRSLILDAALLGPGRAETVVVTTLDAPASLLDETLAPRLLIRAGTGDVDVADALDELGRRGYQRVLCEGGPTLLAHLASAGRLDDLCLTTAPTMVGGGRRRIVHGLDLDPPRHLRLAHLLEENGSLFARYVVDRAP